MTGLESVEILRQNINEPILETEKSIGPEDTAGKVFLEPEKAMSSFDTEDQQPMDHVYSLAVQARDYYDKGNYDAAYEVYWQILQMNVYDSEILFESYKSLGNIFLHDNDFDEAEEFFNKARTIKPNSDTLLVNYGVLEIQRKNLESARDRFRSALDLNVHNDGAWVGLAIVHREFGDIDLAWGNLERSLDENRANQTALMIAMDWGIRDHRLEKAAARIRTYINEVFDSKEMRLSLAKVLFCSGNFVEAKREAEVVLKRDNTDKDALRLVQVIDREVLNRK